MTKAQLEVLLRKVGVYRDQLRMKNQRLVKAIENLTSNKDFQRRFPTYTICLGALLIENSTEPTEQKDKAVVWFELQAKIRSVSTTTGNAPIKKLTPEFADSLIETIKQLKP